MYTKTKMLYIYQNHNWHSFFLALCFLFIFELFKISYLFISFIFYIWIRAKEFRSSPSNINSLLIRLIFNAHNKWLKHNKVRTCKVNLITSSYSPHLHLRLHVELNCYPHIGTTLAQGRPDVTRRNWHVSIKHITLDQKDGTSKSLQLAYILQVLSPPQAKVYIRRRSLNTPNDTLFFLKKDMQHTPKKYIYKW